MQVRMDLQNAGAKGFAPDPPEGKITGRDGKTYPATTKRKTRTESVREREPKNASCKDSNPAPRGTVKIKTR